MGADGIAFAAKIDQVMSDGTRLICSGAFITPHVVLTAAHCTRNYDYGSVITPTKDTVIRYGSGFATSQKIAGDEKTGWRELGSTDIGLYRVANAVTLPVLPKVYRSCSTVDLVGKNIVVYGRMADGNQAPTSEYRCRERTVRGVATGIGANGNYLRIDSTTDAGDSGGPWVFEGDRVVAVTHSSTSSADYGSRFCDVAQEIETQVTAWGDTLTFVEDLSAGGSNGQAGSSATGMSSAGSGGRSGTGGRAGSAGNSGARGGSTASGGASSVASSASATAPARSGGATARDSSSFGTGATAFGGQRSSTGPASTSSSSQASGGAGSGSGNASGGATGTAILGTTREGSGGAAVVTSVSAANGGSDRSVGGGSAHATASTTQTVGEPKDDGCACQLPGRSHFDRSALCALVCALCALVVARRSRHSVVSRKLTA
jgi:hypothetical protein